MPTLSLAQKASIRAVHTTDHTDSLDLYRSPAASSSKIGAVALVTASVPCRVWEATQAPKLVQALPEIAAARAEKIAFFLDTIDVRRGDELRDAAGTKYKVDGLGVWQTVKVAALAAVKPGVTT